MLKGIVGEFILSLPIVISCSLVASRIVSMTFIPLLAFYVLRPGKKPQLSIEERRRTGFSGRYYWLVRRAITHRWKVAFASVGILLLGGFFFSRLKTQFFPDDVQYWAYLDVWLPNDTPLDVTVRLRPVLITVGATVLALFPLAIHGGPLWKPLCDAQIGGLFAATFITLLLVPVLYAIFVLDLKVVAWQSKAAR